MCVCVCFCVFRPSPILCRASFAFSVAVLQNQHFNFTKSKGIALNFHQKMSALRKFIFLTSAILINEKH